MAAITIITIMTVPAAKPSRPSVRFTALHMPTSRMFMNSRYSQGMAMPSPTGTTVVRMPKSSVTTKGISTVGCMPSQFTATSTNAVAMATCPTIFAFGVRPSERSFTTFDASSTRPSRPVSTVAASSTNVSGVGMPTNSATAMTAISMMTPPMVGVPCFTRWLSGPSARTCWPIWLDLRNLIHSGVSTMVTTMANTTARNTRNVGYWLNTVNIAN